jgi:hypothetical protein
MPKKPKITPDGRSDRPARAVDTRDCIAVALNDPRWQFRTVAGLARQCGVPVDDVEQILKGQPGLARKSVMTDRAGCRLYTAAERRIGQRERLEQIRWILAH